MKGSASQRLLFVVFCCLSLFGGSDCSKFRHDELQMLKYRNQKMRREIQHMKREKWDRKNKTKLNIDHFYKKRKNKIRKYLKKHPLKNMHSKKKFQGNFAPKLQRSGKIKMGYIQNLNQTRGNNLGMGGFVQGGVSRGTPGGWAPGYSPMMAGVPMTTGTSMVNPAIMGASFNNYQMPNGMRPAAPLKVLDSVITQESPKQTFQENMADYAQRMKTQEINNGRNQFEKNNLKRLPQIIVSSICRKPGTRPKMLQWT